MHPILQIIREINEVNNKPMPTIQALAMIYFAKKSKLWDELNVLTSGEAKEYYAVFSSDVK